MRVITSIRAACCLFLLAVPAGAAQLDNGTGVQASREVEAVPPPASASRPVATRPGAATVRNRTPQTTRAGARTVPGSSRGKANPP